MLGGLELGCQSSMWGLPQDLGRGFSGQQILTECLLCALNLLAIRAVRPEFWFAPCQSLWLAEVAQLVTNTFETVPYLW